MAKDLAEWALAELKGNSTVTDLVVSGASGIIESGELVMRWLEEQERTRVANDATLGSRILAVEVMDTGEYSFEGTRYARCSVFIVDRGKGYSNIRAAREAILTALLLKPVPLARDAFVKKLGHLGRSGHSIHESFDVDFERVDFQGSIFAMEPDAYA